MKELNSTATLTKPREDSSTKSENSKSKKLLKVSSAAFALATFLALNIALTSFQPFQFDKYQFPYKGWAWWLMKDLRAQTSNHNLVFLGSSLTVAALNTADATYFKENLDLTEYHKTRLLDKFLGEKVGGQFNTFNLSGPGQMPSDAYMSIKAMLDLGQKPEMIIYGVAPRDFIDSELAGPQDTEPFRYLNRVVSIDKLEKDVFHSPLEKINRKLEKNIYFYKNAIDLQMVASGSFEKLVDKVAPEPTSKKPFTYWDRVKLLPEYKKGEFHPKAHMCNPEDLSKRGEYLDNSIEYVHRYKRLNKTSFETQMFFLEKLSRFLKENNISLVLVNMPLTNDNMKLLKPEYYDFYLDRMHSFSKGNDAEFIDMNGHSAFVKADFHDGVHMNARGGIKFVKLLTHELANNPKINNALTTIVSKETGNSDE